MGNCVDFVNSCIYKVCYTQWVMEPLCGRLRDYYVVVCGQPPFEDVHSISTQCGHNVNYMWTLRKHSVWQVGCVWTQVRKIKRKSLMRDSDWLKLNLRFIFLICVQTQMLCNGATMFFPAGLCGLRRLLCATLDKFEFKMARWLHGLSRELSYVVYK